jgi:hypothetical protein
MFDVTEDADMWERRLKLEALIVEVEGMKAENQSRNSRGESVAYAEDSFYIMARQIRLLTKKRLWGDDVTTKKDK